MNKYLMINHGSNSEHEANSAEKWEAYFHLLRANGHFIGGSALAHGIAVKDGLYGPPVSPTVSGYILIQAENMETARSLAWQSPVHHSGGTVDLFKLVET